MIKAEINKLKYDKLFIWSVIIIFIFNYYLSNSIILGLIRNSYGDIPFQQAIFELLKLLWTLLGFPQLIAAIFGAKILSETTEGRMYSYILSSNTRIKFLFSKLVTVFIVNFFFSIFTLIFTIIRFVQYDMPINFNELMLGLSNVINFWIALSFLSILSMFFYLLIKNKFFASILSIFFHFSYLLLATPYKAYHPYDYVFLLLRKKYVSSSGSIFIPLITWKFLIPLFICAILFFMTYYLFLKYEPKD